MGREADAPKEAEELQRLRALAATEQDAFIAHQRADAASRQEVYLHCAPEVSAQVEVAIANERAESFRQLAAAKDEIIKAARDQTKEWRKNAAEVLAFAAKASAGAAGAAAGKDKGSSSSSSSKKK